MAAAYHIFMNGAVKAQTKTGRTNPEIVNGVPKGNPATDGDGSGVVGKTPGGNGGSIVNGR